MLRGAARQAAQVIIVVGLILIGTVFCARPQPTLAQRNYAGSTTLQRFLGAAEKRSVANVSVAARHADLLARIVALEVRLVSNPLAQASLSTVATSPLPLSHDDEAKQHAPLPLSTSGGDSYDDKAQLHAAPLFTKRLVVNVDADGIAWRRLLLWTHARTVLTPMLGAAFFGNIASAFAAPLPAPNAPLLALVGAHIADARNRVRLRATWAALRAPADLHLVFVCALYSLKREAGEALALEAATEGDLLLLPGVVEGVNSKTLPQFGVASALFGNAFRFYMKIDLDSFMLPRPYAVLLRALPAGVPTYGGNEFPRGKYHWNNEVDYMSGGGYFVTPDIAAVLGAACAECWTDAVAALPHSALSGPCPMCVMNDAKYLGEDIHTGRFIASHIKTNKHFANLSIVRVNSYHGTGIGKYHQLDACLSAGLAGSRICNVPPVLIVHSVKDEGFWSRLVAHYRRIYDAGGGDALDAPFRNFVPPKSHDFPFDYMLETSTAFLQQVGQ